MQKTIEIVDDFHPEPMVVRESALGSLGGWRTSTTARGAAPESDSSTDKKTWGRIRRLLGPEAEAGWCGLSRVFFTVAGESAADPGVTHFEHTGWAAMVWLCLPHQCQGGISFYQPRDGGQQPHEWEATMFIPAKFNRLVLFRSSAVYRRGPGFGQTPESGLLSQVILVSRIRPSDRSVCHA